MTRHTGDSYDGIAEDYADSQETKPWALYFERPGALQFLPEVDGMDVLDAGCGPGFFSAHLLDNGANVAAVDLNQQFVELTRARTSGRATVAQADLADPLDLADGSFDLVLCLLTLHYFEDWLPTLREFERVLRPEGLLVISTHHPFTDLDLSTSNDYFATDLLEDEWDVGPVRYYRRPLSKISRDLFAAGFVIEEIGEPQPIEPPDGAEFLSYERAMTVPQRLFLRARTQR